MIRRISWFIHLLYLTFIGIPYVALYVAVTNRSAEYRKLAMDAVFEAVGLEWGRWAVNDNN